MVVTVQDSETNVVSSIAAQLSVTLQGVTTGQAHSVSVALNGSAVGVLNFNDQENYTSTFPVEQGMIHEGTNTVTLTALNGDNDTSLVQTITLQYPAQLRGGFKLAAGHGAGRRELENQGLRQLADPGV